MQLVSSLTLPQHVLECDNIHNNYQDLKTRKYEYVGN